MSPSRTEAWLSQALRLFASSAVALLALIFVFLFSESRLALTDGHWLRFLNSPGWFPSAGQFNLWPMLMATVLATIGALLLAVPLGLASALFIRFFAPPSLSILFRRLIMLLAGIPSVVYGLWGLTMLVPVIASVAPPGASLLAAILILAMMILPTVALTSEAALRVVPLSYWQGGQALGLSAQTILLKIAIPAASRGIFAGVLLATTRALGETMAVLMVAGNVVQMPGSIFDSVRVLTANIALEMAYATGEHRASLYVTSLLLTLVVVVIATVGRRVEMRHD
ncbi:MAG: phosphate ABC transporter permease subunit PstC [Pseudomonadota bacterium]